VSSRAPKLAVHPAALCVVTAFAALIAALAVPDVASAHALVGRRDLPVPAWLFAWGASMVLIVSFALLSVAWTRARLQEEGWRPLPAPLTAVLLGPITQFLCGLAGAALLLLVVYAGLEGTQDAIRNFAIIFGFYTFWLGLVLVSVLFGDVFRAFNPWRAIGRAFSGTFRLIAGQSAPSPFRYPDRLGRWPAVAGVIGFVWLELIHGAGVAPDPEQVATATLVYTAITFACMALFGVEEWIERGEAFSAYFGMFARLSVFEVRDGRLGRRRFLTGATSWQDWPGSAALVLVAIGVTSFDGAQEGAMKSAINSTFNHIHDLGIGTIATFRITNSIWLAIVLAGVGLLYWLGIRGMHTVRGSPSARGLARSFAHTLIPIALAYLVAHYFSALLYQEQAQFTYILSDPLGDGSDLFGTAGGGIDYGLVSSTAVWYVQVGALVAGHVAALTLAHDRALAVYGDVRRATRSQYFMLAVMVGFTCFGLFLLSQANA
jgi:hypothetical protein